MVRYISFSQLQSKLCEAARKQEQAIYRYNEEVRRHNQRVKQAVDKYNQEVRAYNARLRANRDRLRSELVRLSRQPVTTRYVTFRASVHTLNDAHTRLELRAETHLDSRYNHLLDLSEREAANSVSVMNSLLGNAADSQGPADTLQDATLTEELKKISEDLDNRWRGAVFALNPHNPDAARHFCTSAREVITQILELKAPDTHVIQLMPDCGRTEQGKPTRRSKIKFFLHRKGMLDDVLEEFVDEDMQNIVELFQIFNDGTHGSAGTFDLQQLSVIRKRVEDGIMFLSRLIE